MARIGINAVPLEKLHGGISYYVFFILKELIPLRPEDTFFLFVANKGPDLSEFSHFKNVKIVTIPQFSFSQSIWEQTSLAFGCWKYKIDIFWGTTQSIPLISRSGMKKCMSLYDFVYLICPETMSTYRKIYLRLFSKWMYEKSDLILPISEGTKEKFSQFYNKNSGPTITPPLKPLDRPLEECPLKIHSFLITVGTPEPRKNFEKLLNSYVDFLGKTDPANVLPLVIAGGGGWKNQKILKTLESAKRKFPSHVHLLGYVTDDTLAKYLSHARYSIMVSKYEGYGMPIAESRICKTAVICLNLKEMKEAAENDAIFLNPDCWEEEIQPYFLISKEFTAPKNPTYGSNLEKARLLSKEIDSCLLSKE